VKLDVISDFIFHAKGLLSPDLCRQIIEQFDADPARHVGYGLDARGKPNVSDYKVSVELEIHPQGIWKAPHEAINAQVASVVQTLIDNLPSLQIEKMQWSQYKIKRYAKDEGHFKWHFDAMGPGAWGRQVAMILYLNDVQKGGETCFLYQNIKFKPVAGDALFFPTFWTHHHCGLVPLSGDKYIITSFVTFAIPGVKPSGEAA
jgi:hypothetical protein